ncbi:MAG: AI-2E family transporter, partial [Gammaproteobacteria bacterium]|nr:AI-2E family transporter [Gammaproteobacteria bacterium]
MNTVAKPDVPPSAETHSDVENRAVVAEEAVTSIASQPGVRVQADVRNLSLTVLTVLAVIFVLHWARAFFIPLMLGIMISYAFSPLVNRMQKWRIPRAIGAAV